MEFGLFDHMDRNDKPDSRLYRSRIEIIQAAEAAGFTGYHLAEHHFTPLGLAPSPSVFLSVVAHETSRMRLGPLVYLLPMYHPLRLIEEICMLDQMSDGRLDIGVGAGVSPYEVGYYGIGDDKNGLYRETLEILIKGLTSERLNHRSAHHTFENVPMVMKPVQSPMPPMWAGVGSEAGMVFAARHGINAIGLGPTSRIAGICDFYKKAWEEHRDDPMRAFAPTQNPKMGALRQIHVAETDEKAWEEAAPAYEHWYNSLKWLWREHSATVSTNLAGDLKSGIDNGAVIVGSPDTVRAAIQKERDATGYNYLVLQFAYGTFTVEQVKRSLQLFSSEVIPALRT
ncbi:MAG: LLM class flavin-dependent oxidoreductase [Hyphomicrobiales bacterium]|nr:LLM class flavin-dependent oxidoreductase [Hyphomicrobiales bacterium]